VGRESRHNIRKAFTRRSSLRSELRTLGIPVVDDATVDVLGMCLYASPLRSVGICHYYMLPDFRKGTIIFISA
jgi:hypothetical protein